MLKGFLKATHCQYAGCMRPLSKHPVNRNTRWYCDNGCARRGNEFIRERQEIEKKAQYHKWLLEESRS